MWGLAVWPPLEDGISRSQRLGPSIDAEGRGEHVPGLGAVCDYLWGVGYNRRTDKGHKTSSGVLTASTP